MQWMIVSALLFWAGFAFAAEGFMLETLRFTATCADELRADLTFDRGDAVVPAVIAIQRDDDEIKGILYERLESELAVLPGGVVTLMGLVVGGGLPFYASVAEGKGTFLLTDVDEGDEIEFSSYTTVFGRVTLGPDRDTEKINLTILSTAEGTGIRPCIVRHKLASMSRFTIPDFVNEESDEPVIIPTFGVTGSSPSP